MNFVAKSRMTRYTLYCNVVILLVGSFYFYINLIHFATALENDSKLFGLDSTPFNKTRGEWLAKYWNWTASISKSEHPRFDTTGQHCNVAQQGPMWFLDGPVSQGTVVRSISCTIPADKGIFIPLLTGECDYAEEPTDEAVTKCAKEGNDEGNIVLDLDGKRLLSIENTNQDDYSYRVTSDFFRINYNPSNVWGLEPGEGGTLNFRARADGYFAILQPLSPGHHIIHFHTTVLRDPKLGYNYNLDMTYKVLSK